MTRLFPFAPKDFDRLRGLVRRHTGISLSELKQDMVYRRLSPRLKELGLTSFGEYCQRLSESNGEEIEQFTNAITTNLTAFFREPHHFEYLANTALPELIAKKRCVAASADLVGRLFFRRRSLLLGDRRQRVSPRFG